MIKPDQIEEWLLEVEARPASATVIIRQIANRLKELAEKNEELLGENIQLRSGEKIEEYELRIANLEYQLEMLKRQVGGPASAPYLETLSLLVYDNQGRILRLELQQDDLAHAGVCARFPAQIASMDEPPRLLVLASSEELLCVFDSGRSLTMPAVSIPAVEGKALDWGQAFLLETRGGEELAAVLPIARMALFEFCVQVSRRGFVKKTRRAFLESYIAKGNIGAGVVLPYDKTFSLALCDQDDSLVMISKDGYLFSAEVDQLPYTIEEVQRLSKTDYVALAFMQGKKGSILGLTQNGKAFHREFSWLGTGGSLKIQGKPILSKSRREAGTRIVGAAAVDEDDWVVVMTNDGKLTIYKMGRVFGDGSILDNSSGLEILTLAAFNATRN